ncbi:hypothetical protein [Sphingomonas endophytica]|uniref:hypothetical protein n=1 Tax=Sphingomonas endophytica TaxID=869719 RepID=UPI001C87CA5E|nr:hypothetical protein [Sphingomonas endophytica]
MSGDEGRPAASLQATDLLSTPRITERISTTAQITSTSSIFFEEGATYLAMLKAGH